MKILDQEFPLPRVSGKEGSDGVLRLGLDVAALRYGSGATSAGAWVFKSDNLAGV
jgi:hypothetical protein